MSDPRIEWISGYQPNDEREYPISHRVGYDGITAIEYELHNYGDHGIGVYNVFKDGTLFSTVSHRAVAEIRYFEPSGEDE